MKNGIRELELFLRTQTGADTVKVIDSFKFTAGAIQENWGIDVEFIGGLIAGSQELCLRMDAPTKIENSRSRSEEYLLLKLAFENGVRVPEPLFLCENEEVIGRPFFVMRRIAGVADGRSVTKVHRSVDQQNQLLFDLGVTLAKIHTLNPSSKAFRFLNKRQIPPAVSVVSQYIDALDKLPEPAPVLEWGLRWAKLNLPKEQIPVFCHRDYRTGNLMIEDNNLIGVLDWEFAGWSDPMEDVAWFCSKCWRFGFNDREAGGIGSRTAFYEGYEKSAQREIDHEAIKFWEIMAHIRWAIIARQQGERFATSGEKSLEPAMTTFIAPQLEWEVMKMTGDWGK